MSQVLVTGGAGFIGSHLVERLVREGHELLVVDDLSLGRRDNLGACADRIELIEASVLDVEAWAPRARARGVHTVVHLAAEISGQDSLWHPERYLEANLTGLLRLLEGLGADSARRFVFASSATVYGPSASLPSREADAPAPVTPYALSKLAGEHLLAMYAPLRGYTFAALRLFNVYGPRQRPDHPYANVTGKLAHAAATGAPFTLYGDGAQTRDFVYVDDVVDALVRAARSERSGSYNIGTGREASVRAVMEAVARHAPGRLEVHDAPPWPNDVRRVCADIRAASDELGWAPRVSLDEGLARTVAHFREATA